MSDNPEFRKCVYINPDLSPAELQLAYERRQHKRAHKVLRNAAAGDHGTKSTNITSRDTSTKDAHKLVKAVTLLVVHHSQVTITDQQTLLSPAGTATPSNAMT